MTTRTNATVLTVGEWGWTDCGEYWEPALNLGKGFEVRVGNKVTAAYLARLSRDLMKLADLVSQRAAGTP